MKPFPLVFPLVFPLEVEGPWGPMSTAETRPVHALGSSSEMASEMASG